jgi:hypothetical protein
MFKKIALLLAVIACTTFAQKDNTFVGSGSKAVLFSFSGLSVLGANNFDGGAGFKLYLNSPLALRVGVMVDASGTTIPANPQVGQTGTDGSTSQTIFGLEAALEYHLTTTRVSPFLGGGIQFATSSNESKDVVYGNTPQTTIKNSNDNGLKAGTSFNIFALMGVEYFIVDAVSLAAEYQLGYSILSPSDRVTSQGNISVTEKGISSHDFALNSAGFLTLAVYF